MNDRLVTVIILVLMLIVLGAIFYNMLVRTS